MKTNKAFRKRLKVTKSGKILARKLGQNHYNAKQSPSKRTEKRKLQEVKFTNKTKARFIDPFVKFSK